MICSGSPRSVHQFRRERPSLKTIPEEETYSEEESRAEHGPADTFLSNHAAWIAFERQTRSLPPYVQSMELTLLARVHASHMAAHQTVFHSVASIAELKDALECETVGENIIRGDCVLRMHQETMTSTSTSSSSMSINRSNILSTHFNEFGSAIAIGTDGRIYCCQYFRQNLRL